MKPPKPEEAQEPQPEGATAIQEATSSEQSEGQPTEVTNVMREFMAMFMGPASHPLINKLTPDHLSKAMDNSHELEKEEVKTRRSGRWFQLGYVFVGIGLFVFLAVFLNSIGQWETFEEILKGTAIFLGGSGAGYGVATRRKARRSDE